MPNTESTLVEEIVARFRHRLIEAGVRMRHARSPRAFFDVEREVHDLGRELADEFTARILEDVVSDEARAWAATDQVRERAEAKGIELRTQGRRTTPVQLLGGTVIRVQTAYLCAKPRGDGPREQRGKAGTGVYPVLDEMGITDRATPALRLRVAHAVCEANSTTDARELMRQSGLSLSHRVALRLTYATTKLALKARRRAVRRTNEGNDAGPFAGRHVVACVDGGRVRIRRALPGRPPKGGRRRFEREWREPRVLTLYTLDEHGRRDKSIRSVIDGTLGNADDTFALLCYHLRHVGAHRAASLTLVADGAKWIWKRASGLRDMLNLDEEVEFTEVVDYFHVVERLTEFAKARPGWSEKQSTTWVKRQKGRLKRGWIERIEKDVAKVLTPEEKKKGTELAYWRRNRERMRYSTFRKRGLPNGSGAVESAVRRVINLRLKGPSIVWREDHAEGVIHLRAHAKAGRWDAIEDVILENCRWVPTTRRRPVA